jgi:cell division protein FtsI/penicillin-binding protein 2
MARAQAPELFAQSANAALRRNFSNPDLTWILMDRSGKVLAQRWPAANDAIPPGSLVKPFLAMAWSQQFGNRFPRVRCMGTKTLCWLPRGHGELGLEDAIAHSCNTYFLALAGKLDVAKALPVFRSFGLAGPPPNSDARTLIGLSTAWRETPLALARAYLLLLDGDPESAVRFRVLQGMAGAASYGTAAAVDSTLGQNAALAKTGTAACTHPHRAAADGFAIVAFPATDPRFLLLVQKHGATGAHAAAEAAQMLQDIGLGQP